MTYGYYPKIIIEYGSDIISWIYNNPVYHQRGIVQHMIRDMVGIMHLKKYCVIRSCYREGLDTNFEYRWI